MKRSGTRLFTGLLALLLLATLAVGYPGRVAAAPAQQTGAQTFTVLVGAEAEIEQTENGPAGAWQIMKFYPDKITVNEGDTIIWKLNSTEFHTVVFPPPGKNYVPLTIPQGNDVLIDPSIGPIGGPNYDGTAEVSLGMLSKTPPGVTEGKLTFTKAGTYNYLCTVHSTQLPNGQVVGMVGQVTVQAAGSALPKTPAQVSADAQASIAADQQAAMAADSQAKAVTPPTAGANGTMTYHINAGFDTQDASYMRFSPSDVTIHVGDTVEWTQNSAVTPHTFTLTSGAKDPDLILVTPQQSGPPVLKLNPQVLAPAGGTSYAGTGFYSSGFVSGTQDPAPGPRSYSLTFTKPGTYEYICMLHDDMGMNGHITVLAAGTTPGMPATGQPDSLPLILGLSALAMLLGGVTLRRMRPARR